MHRTLSSAIALAVVAAPAAAQTAPPQTGMGGPVVPGVCLLSREAIFANAKVGLAANARLKVLSDAAQAEVDALRAPLESEIRQFQAEAGALAPEERSRREQALAVRLQPVQALAQQRSREIDATRQKALQTIADQAQPVIQQVYAGHGCGLLADRNTMLGGNFTNDLTADVVAALDQRISTITFEREQLVAAPDEAAVRP
ncbi:MAG: hypothetical protein B7Z33_10225 [Sphingomonadales bacterium 12-68-11]|nr:MAG: hypothetical protein B7Z33_10225 [Sphingomonadales bacterium 12-68-11]